MRRPTTVELMLLTTVVLWSLNLSITKYILEEGVQPLSYATVRYALAGAIFVALTLLAERTLRMQRRHLPVLAFAAVVLAVNQLCFVFALDLTTASTIGLILGAIPFFAAIFGLALGRELGKRGLGRLCRHPARTWDLCHLGGVFRRRGTVDDRLLAVAGQCPGDPRNVGIGRGRRDSADE
jgi:CDP-diglyceride synthetase